MPGTAAGSGCGGSACLGSVICLGGGQLGLLEIAARGELVHHLGQELGQGRGHLVGIDPEFLGDLLHGLIAQNGLDLLGLDPYLPETKIEYSSSVRVERRAISLDDRADVVFLNHSLEHSDLPVAELERIRTILSINGAIIVSIPVVDSEPYIRFGANLVSLDAPVHRWIPTVEGVSAVAERSGFRIDAMVRTNPDFLYWGSEAVARGLPMDRGSVAQALGIEYMLSLERSARLAQRNQGGNLTFRLRHVD